jgi:hypothetical protein
MRRNETVKLLAFALIGASWLPALGQGTPVTPTTPSAVPRAAATPAAAPAAAPAASQAAKPTMSAQELEQLVAPIALYPDSLLSQILMASTYPLEIVQADRFAKTNAKLAGDALTAQLEKQDWDASVKSLVNFPTVLSMMSEKLDSTIKLGDAFLADQKGVMDAVQKLRGKAKAQGNLETTKEQTVIVEQAPATQTQVIRIEPAQPEVVYVPTYNPTVVYGAWPYPAYPPYYWYPPGYVASGVIGFGLGVAAGAAWGYAWGHCNWGGGDVDIDVNRNANINRNIDRSKYQNQINALQNNRQGAGAGNRQGSWQHDPSHRQGVAYRDQNTSQRFGGANTRDVQSREAFRGRAEAGQADIARGGASEFRGANGVNPNISRGGAGAGGPGGAGGGGLGGAGSGGLGGAGGGGLGGAGGANRPSAAPRPANPSVNRPSSPSVSPRPSTGGSGMSGVGGGGRATQSASQRGSVSRTSSAGARPSGGVSRPAGGGGGARAGGGGGRR